MFRASELDRLTSKVQLLGLETIDCVIASVISNINTDTRDSTTGEVTDPGTVQHIEGQEVGEKRSDTSNVDD